MKPKLMKNIASLFLWQGTNYVLPLVTLPYLTRTLGPKEYGVLGFAITFGYYLVMLTNWAFGLSAVQQVAACRADPVRLNEVFWSTLFAKAFLGTGSLLLLYLLIAFIPMLHPYAAIMQFACCIMIPAAALQTDWYLQGMELMGRFAVASVIGRLVPIPLIFLLVRSPADVDIAALLQGISGLTASATAIYMTLGTKRIGRMVFSLRAIWETIRAGSHLFLSTTAVSLYVNLNTIAVTSIAGPLQGGLFVGADKIRGAVTGLVQPISLAVYPHLANMVVTDRARMFRTVRKLFYYQGGLTLVLAIGTWVFAPLAVRILLGPAFITAVPVLRALAPVPFLVGLNNITGTQIMLPLGYRREFMIMVTAPALLSLIYMPLSAYWHGAVGVAWSLSFTELLVNLFGAWLLHRRRHELRVFSKSGIGATEIDSPA